MEMTHDEIQTLANHLTDKRNDMKKYREIFTEKIISIDNGDQLILAMKQALTDLQKRDEKIQDLLIWINAKSQLINSQYNLATIRALYLAIIRIIYLDFEKAFNNPQAGGVPARNYVSRLIKSDNFMENIPFDPSERLNFGFDPIGVFVSLCVLQIEPELIKFFEELKSVIPHCDQEKVQFNQWRKENGQHWVQRLQGLIDFDLNFSEFQKESLKQYYYAHNLLVACLETATNLSPQLKNDLEQSLLLPF
jgi:hypothetical protein